MSDSNESPDKPAVLRHGGAHRVTVAPGAKSALSSAPPTAGPRLRPAAGPIPPSLRARSTAAAQDTGTSIIRTEAHTPPAAPSPRSPRPRADLSRWLPPAVDAADQASGHTDLQERLARLMQANAETSRIVSALERDISAAVPPNRSLP